jgi:hypothetical protein
LVQQMQSVQPQYVQPQMQSVQPQVPQMQYVHV